MKTKSVTGAGTGGTRRGDDQPMKWRRGVLGYAGRCGGADFGVGLASCWLRTFTDFARHFQQSGASCTKPSPKVTVVHSVDRSHHVQVASACHWDKVTSMIRAFPMREGSTHVWRQLLRRSGLLN